MFRAAFSLFSTLCLILMGLGLFALSTSAVAHDLPCDIEYPSGFGWANNFSFVGPNVLVDDECGMTAPLIPGRMAAGATKVSFDLGSSAPYRMSYDLYLETRLLEVASSSRLVVLDMIQQNQGEVFVELLLLGRDRVQVKIHTDAGPITSGNFTIPVTGAMVTVDVTRSLTNQSRDGEVRLLIDGQTVFEIIKLDLFDHPPDTVRLGLVSLAAPSMQEGGGELRFQPAGVFHQIFP